MEKILGNVKKRKGERQRIDELCRTLIMDFLVIFFDWD